MKIQWIPNETAVSDSEKKNYKRVSAAFDAKSSDDSDETIGLESDDSQKSSTSETDKQSVS